MPRRIIEVDGQQWEVAISGRFTQFNKDEFGLVFTRGQGRDREVRVMRYNPRFAKQRELSFNALSDADLKQYLVHSQPAWTSPDLEYRR
jgi:hypothetical protein